MRYRPLALLVALSLASATGAQAGTLSSATWTTGLGFVAGPFQASIGVPILATGTSTSTSVSILLNLTPTSFQETSTAGAVPLQRVFRIGGTAGLTATPNGAAATMSVPAKVTVRTLMYQSGFIPGTTVLKVPLRVGVGGQHLSGFTIFGVPHLLTVDFYGWTPGTVSFTGLTSNYYALPTPTLVAMGSFALDAMGSGMVTLVAPTRLAIDGSLLQRRSVDFTELRLTFVPEPSALLLLAAGAASLGLVARRRPD